MNWYKRKKIAIKLNEIYDEEELTDSSEYRYDYITEEDLDRDFTVRTFSPDEAKQLLTPIGDATVWSSYSDHASEDQRSIVEYKSKFFDDSRIVLIANNTLLDGHHHLIAAILSNKPVKYIDLYE